MYFLKIRYDPIQLVSIAPLVIFRVIFGATVLVGTIRFYLLGWIEEQYINTKFHFNYYGFEWVPFPTPWGIYALFILLALSGLCVIIGLAYRISAFVLFLSFTWIELLDKTYYLNHYYLISLIAFLMIFLSAGNFLSFDQWILKKKSISIIPRFQIDILKFQIGIVYIFAGIAKINQYWLFEALPLKIWLPANNSMPFMGSVFNYEITAYIFSWAGMIFDCTIVFFLLNRKTQLIAWFVALFFHAVTGWMFQIGMFPLIMSLAILIFFHENFHIRIIELFKNIFKVHHIDNQKDIENSMVVSMHNKLIMGFVIIYILFQLIFPWRYLLYPGNLFLTEEGYRFSWRVMLMEKAGNATFYVTDYETNKEGIVNNSEFLNAHQEKQMAMQPDMILQFAQYLGKYYHASKVRAEVYITLNGGKSVQLIDSEVNLLNVKESFKPKKFLNRKSKTLNF
ncbi:MAG: HTTM domain-containing protein [Bacteroidota bacterium]|nr:HTTM domain-containing protein [Bacteroidota bacterium]